MRALTLVGAVNDALRTEMALDPAVVVFGEDVGREGGVFRATEDLQELFGAARCFDTPLAEAGIVGAAVGMAVAGLRPVVEIQFAGFAFPAFDQLVNHAARMRTRSRGSLSAPLVIRMPYGGGIAAPEHHSESPEAMFANIAGLKVVIPSTPYDAKGLLISSIRDPDPVVFLEPSRIYRSARQEVPEEPFTIELGRARIEQEGGELTLISYGAQMKEARQAAALLKQEGRSVELLDLRTIYPLDAEAVMASVSKTGRLLVVHEGPAFCGVAAEVIALVLDSCFVHLQAPPSRLTGADTVFPLPRGERHYLISVEAIAQEARRLLAFEP
jgi:pyruvate dehydrogenase E1 component beta subunit